MRINIKSYFAYAYATAVACGGVIGDGSDASSQSDGASNDGTIVPGDGEADTSTDVGTSDGGCVATQPPPCDAGGVTTCSGCATPVVVAACQNNPSPLAIDQLNVYWRNLGDAGPKGQPNVPVKYTNGTASVSPKSGFPYVLADHFTYYSDEALALMPVASRLYVSNIDVDDAGHSAIWGFDVNTCTDVPKTSVIGYGDAFTASSVNIYWTRENVWSCTLGGCAQPEAIWVAPSDDRAMGVVADSTDLYWTTLSGTILSCPVVGCAGAPKVVFSAKLTFSTYLTMDSENLYGSSSLGIVKCAKSGCLTPTIVGTGSGPIATDGINIYWTNGDVFACSVGGCSSSTRIATSGAAAGVAVDDQYVYWADTSLGMVLRVTK